MDRLYYSTYRMCDEEVATSTQQPATAGTTHSRPQQARRSNPQFSNQLRDYVEQPRPSPRARTFHSEPMCFLHSLLLEHASNNLNSWCQAFRMHAVGDQDGQWVEAGPSGANNG